MPKTVSKDVPLSEITLRRYERPYDMPKRELVKKVCLSVGLLQPGDSRDVIVDVLHVLLDSKDGLDPEAVVNTVVEYRKSAKVPLKGIAASNVRRQLKRLRNLYLVEKVNNSYRIAESENLNLIFEERIEKFLLPLIVKRVKEYLKALK